MIFADRRGAGKRLAPLLEKYRGMKYAIVLGLPRGGVITADEVARELELPLDITVPRKLGAPGNEEFAIGAITEDGGVFLNEEAVRMSEAAEEYIEKEKSRQKKEAERRMKVYRAGRGPLDLKGETVIVVDDGIATGATMKAAIFSVRAKGAAKVVVAAPVGSSDTIDALEDEADEVVVFHRPEFFMSVGQFYETFDQTSDEEVMEILSAKRSR